MTSSVSCASAGNCSAAGTYVGIPGGSLLNLPFVITQTGGTWGKAEEIPGIAALNKERNGLVYSVSCGAVGTCSAVGSYQNTSSTSQAFVTNQTHGTWRTAAEFPGLAALNVGGAAQAFSVSCPSAGHCAAGGSYMAKSGFQAFVVSKT